MKHRINILFLTVVWFVSALFVLDEQVKWTIAITGSIVFFLVLSAGVFHFPFNYFMKATHRFSSDRVLLTFDDGPNDQLTPQILDTLKEHNIAAVFFVIGQNATAHPELIQRMVNEGHLIGNHTFSHPPLFAMLPQRKVSEEINQCTAAVSAITKRKPVMFRPPIGYTNPNISRAVKELNVRPIGWSLRSFDTVIKDPVSLRKRIEKSIRPGMIVLLHDSLPQTAAMLPELISSLQQKGITFTTAEELKNWQS